MYIRIKDNISIANRDGATAPFNLGFLQFYKVNILPLNFQLPCANFIFIHFNSIKRAMINSIKNNSFKSSINAVKRDLFNQPLTNKELDNFDGIVINPPRNGAENQCKFIYKSSLKKIVYVSCNLDTFMRDTKLFVDKYKLEKLYLVDQFYMSKHFEVIGVFNLKNTKI